MMLSFCFLIFLLLLSRKYKAKSFVYIYSLWYLVILIDYLFMQNVFVPFSESFDTFFLFFSFLFIFMYLIFDEVISFSGRIKFPKFQLFSYKTYFCFSVFLGLFSVLLFIKAFISMPILLARAKIASNELSFHVGISFPFVSSCLFYQNFKNYKKYKKLLIVLIFLLALISSSKQFIILAILFAIPWYKKNFKFSLLPILFVFSFGFLLILLLHAVTGRVAGSGNLFQKTVYTINGYLLGGLAAFQLFLDGTMESHITVGGWVKTGDWIGNVYSGFYGFYQNRNIFLLSLKVLAISLLYAFLNSKRKSMFLNFMRIYSLYPLLFFIFSDLYFSAVKQWFVFVIAGISLLFIKQKEALKCPSVQ